MGSAHTEAYTRIAGFAVVGFVVNSNVDRAGSLAKRLGLSVPVFSDFAKALRQLKPDVVSINTPVDSHAALAIQALNRGCHVFVEKPLGRTVAEAKRVVRAAKEKGRALLVGYSLRFHPAWITYVDIARTLGKPLVMRMTLNQQSAGEEWSLQKRSISKLSPMVSCGVHYVDLMCQMVGARPLSVQGIAARVSEEIGQDDKNYGAMQLSFADGSVGWFEAGWGPMFSRSATFIQDIVGPRGSVSMERDMGGMDPSDVSRHTSANSLVVHSSSRESAGRPVSKDETIPFDDEPGHVELCVREQEFLLSAIDEGIDLSTHHAEAMDSLAICLAAVRALGSGRVVRLEKAVVHSPVQAIGGDS
jgi:predicted dehydrogenase